MTVEVLFFTVPTGIVLWANQPAAETYFLEDDRFEIPADLTGCTEARLILWEGDTPPHAGARVGVQFQVQDGSWLYLGSLNGTDGPFVTLSGGGGRNLSPWVPLRGGAKGSIVVRLMGAGGDGAADPTFTRAVLQVR